MRGVRALAPLILAGLLLTGCSGGTDDPVTGGLQQGVVGVADAASRGDLAAAEEQLVALEGLLAEAVSDGSVDETRRAGIQSAIDRVRVDLVALGTAETPAPLATPSPVRTPDGRPTPAVSPGASPSESPSADPTPSASPSAAPSAAPSDGPSASPSSPPSATPSETVEPSPSGSAPIDTTPSPSEVVEDVGAAGTGPVGAGPVGSGSAGGGSAGVGSAGPGDGAG